MNSPNTPRQNQLSINQHQTPTLKPAEIGLHPTILREVISGVLQKHGINNLQLEMELTTEIRNRFVSKITVSKQSLATAISDGAKEFVIKEKIHHQITRLMGMNIVGKDAEQFMDYALSRSKHGEDIEKFSSWWITNNPDPKFWSFTRMMQLWPQAFKEEKKNSQLDFHAKWDKEFVPPPE